MLSCRNRLLVKTELKMPFCTALQASPIGFFRFQIADFNLEFFDKNENFQTPVAALDRNTISKCSSLCRSCSFSVPHLIEKWVNSHLSHTQTYSLFTFLIVSHYADNQTQPNVDAMYRNVRRIVSIIDIFSTMPQNPMYLNSNLKSRFPRNVKTVDCGKIAWLRRSVKNLQKLL